MKVIPQVHLLKVSWKESHSYVVHLRLTPDLSTRTSQYLCWIISTHCWRYFCFCCIFIWLPCLSLFRWMLIKFVILFVIQSIVDEHRGSVRAVFIEMREEQPLLTFCILFLELLLGRFCFYGFPSEYFHAVRFKFSSYYQKQTCLLRSLMWISLWLKSW